VIDRVGDGRDPDVPTLARALNLHEVQRHFGRGVPRLAGERGFVHVRAVRMTRLKPGRRAVLEYDVEVERPDRPPEQATLVGKVSRRRSGESAFQLLVRLWDAGFAADCADGVSVPEPVGVVAPLQLWLQRKVSGRQATDLLPGPDRAALARRIAAAAHKLHQAGVPPTRRHTMADELRILHERLALVARAEPGWAIRIERLLEASGRRAAATPTLGSRGVHRDFYADQVLVDGARLWLLDFDLYCEADPALDTGNFCGHVTEQSLRTLGDPAALADVEAALEERFVELTGEAARPAVRAYAVLTLVRHIQLSTQFADRRPYTGRLLELCEERLGLAAQPRLASA
jgi:hypothetical protein